MLTGVGIFADLRVRTPASDGQGTFGNGYKGAQSSSATPVALGAGLNKEGGDATLSQVRMETREGFFTRLSSRSWGWTGGRVRIKSGSGYWLRSLTGEEKWRETGPQRLAGPALSTSAA